MTPSEVLKAVVTAAAERKWTDITEFAGRLSPPDDGSVLVFADSAAIASGLEAAFPNAAFRWARHGVTAASPTEAIEANRFIIERRVDRPLDAATRTLFRELISNSPETFRILVTGVSGMESPEEFRRIHRGLWRLIANDGTTWLDQDLAERGCLLWADPPSVPALSDHLERDRSLLGDWLRTPAPIPEALVSARAEHAVALFAAHLDVDEHTGDQVTGTALDAVLEKVAEARRLAEADIAEAAELAQRLLTTSLTLAEQTLVTEASAVAERHGANNDSFGREVERFLSGGIAAWRRSFEPELRAHGERAVAAVRDRLNSCWPAVTAIAPELAAPLIVDSSTPEESPSAASGPARNTDGTSMDSDRPLLFGALTAAALTATRQTAKYAVPGGAAVFLIAAAVLRRRKEQQTARDTAMIVAKLGEIFAELRDAEAQRVKQVFDDLVAELDQEFNRIDTELKAIVPAATQATTADQDLLQQFRNYLSPPQE